MAAINQVISKKVAGDDIRVDRTYPDLPSGETVNKAYLTVKQRESDADPGIFQITITGTLTSSGHVTDGATPDVSLFFNILKTQSALLKPLVSYFYDVQLHTADGDIWTAEKGTITLERGITLATS